VLNSDVAGSRQPRGRNCPLSAPMIQGFGLAFSSARNPMPHAPFPIPHSMDSDGAALPPEPLCRTHNGKSFHNRFHLRCSIWRFGASKSVASFRPGFALQSQAWSGGNGSSRAAIPCALVPAQSGPRTTRRACFRDFLLKKPSSISPIRPTSDGFETR
jgi:hypothetical protein